MTLMANKVNDYLTVKEQRVAIHDMSPSTVRQYSVILEKIWLPFCEEEDITEPSQAVPSVMYKFTAAIQRRTRNGKELGRESQRTYVRAVRLFLNWAHVEKGDFRAPKKQIGQRREVLSRAEIDELESAASDERDRLVVRTLADTGIRVSELLGLRLQDLHENSHDRKFFIEVTGKGSKTRLVPIPSALFRRLKAYAMSGGPKDAPFVFMGKRRDSTGQFERLTRSGAHQLLANLALTAQLGKKANPHLFRHSYVTHQLQKGTPPAMVQRVVGHESSALVMEVYNQINAGDAYAQVIDALKKR